MRGWQYAPSFTGRTGAGVVWSSVEPASSSARFVRRRVGLVLKGNATPSHVRFLPSQCWIRAVFRHGESALTAFARLTHPNDQLRVEVRDIGPSRPLSQALLFVDVQRDYDTRRLFCWQRERFRPLVGWIPAKDSWCVRAIGFAAGHWRLLIAAGGISPALRAASGATTTATRCSWTWNCPTATAGSNPRGRTRTRASELSPAASSASSDLRWLACERRRVRSSFFKALFATCLSGATKTAGSGAGCLTRRTAAAAAAAGGRGSAAGSRPCGADSGRAP